MKPFVAAVAVTTALFAGAVQASLTYLPVGPQGGVSLATILGGGWTQCYSGTMSQSIGFNGEQVLNACTDTYLMMAGRETGANTFMALSAVLRSDTIVDTGQSRTNFHVSNGAEWWFSPNYSWGFADLGATLNNFECTRGTVSPLNMCLHTLGVGGFRIDSIENLNGSVGYEKVFFQASAATVPEPSSIALAGLALLGLAAARRRRA